VNDEKMDSPRLKRFALMYLPALAVLIFFLAGVSQARSVQASPAHSAASCGTYKVGLHEFGSLYYRNAQGKLVGIDKDLIEEVARRTGCTLPTELESRVRIWLRLEEGSLDLTVSALKTPEREAVGVFLPYAYSRNFLLLRKNDEQKITTWADFAADRTLTLGVIKSFRHGSTIDAWIDGLRTQGRVQDYADAEVLMRVFYAGRIQGFFSSPVAWQPLLKRYGLLDQVRMLDLTPKDQTLGGLYFLRGRVSDADAERMRRAMRDMRADGTMEKIFARHMDPAHAKSITTLPEP
jgi:polar amino acid transport system substrate-binding protein